MTMHTMHAVPLLLPWLQVGHTLWLQGIHVIPLVALEQICYSGCTITHRATRTAPAAILSCRVAL
jgi:hypothetical protein